MFLAVKLLFVIMRCAERKGTSMMLWQHEFYMVPTDQLFKGNKTKTKTKQLQVKSKTKPRQDKDWIRQDQGKTKTKTKQNQDKTKTRPRQDQDKTRQDKTRQDEDNT